MLMDHITKIYIILKDGEVFTVSKDRDMAHNDVRDYIQEYP